MENVAIVGTCWAELAVFRSSQPFNVIFSVSSVEAESRVTTHFWAEVVGWADDWYGRVVHAVVAFRTGVAVSRLKCWLVVSRIARERICRAIAAKVPCGTLESCGSCSLCELALRAVVASCTQSCRFSETLAITIHARCAGVAICDVTTSFHVTITTPRAHCRVESS